MVATRRPYIYREGIHMARELSEKHKRAMQAGRKRKQDAKRKGAAERVRKFRAWNEALAAAEGAEAKRIVSRRIKHIVIPDDADFRMVRGEE
jgi:hypothetical protein